MIPAIVFSRDRACQLDALLQTLPTDVFWPVHVVFTKTSRPFHVAYVRCMLLHTGVVFVSELDFRDDVEMLIPESGPVCFFTDDDVVFGPIDEAAIEAALADERVAAFSLRLGLNTTHCYPHDTDQQYPPELANHDGVVRWWWPDAELDFGYPLSLDGHVMRVEDVRRLLDGVDFSNPNELEDALAHRARSLALSRPFLAAFQRSVLVGVPANRVNETHPNRHGGTPGFDVGTLNDRFVDGWRIDPAMMDFRDVAAAHQEVPYVLWTAS